MPHGAQLPHRRSLVGVGGTSSYCSDEKHVCTTTHSVLAVLLHPAAIHVVAEAE